MPRCGRRALSRLRATDLVVLAAILAVLLAWPLGSPPIAERGEAREALVVRDVAREGHWVLPRRNGQIPSKPPLYHWIGAAGARIFGLSDRTMRLPSALAAWVVAATTLALGAATGGRLVGWLAAGALLGMQPFWEAAARARVDMVFAACLAVSYGAFFLWTRDGHPAARAVCWLATTAAVLAKGPAGAVLIGTAVVAFLALERDLGRLRALWSWPLAATALGIVGGWFVLAWLDGGTRFLRVQLVYENVDRFVGRHAFAHSRARAPLGLAVALATQLLPWSLALAWAPLAWWRGAREDAAGRFLHVWWLTVLGIFTLAAGKRSIYLLPLFPAVALLAGRALARALAAPGFPEPAFARRLAPAAPRVALVATLIVALDLGVLVATHAVREVRERRRSLAPFAAEVVRQVGGAPLAAGRGLNPSDLIVLAYLLDRPIARAPVVCPAEGWWLVPAHRKGRFAGGRQEVVAAWRREKHDVALLRCRTPA